MACASRLLISYFLTRLFIISSTSRPQSINNQMSFEYFLKTNKSPDISSNTKISLCMYCHDIFEVYVNTLSHLFSVFVYTCSKTALPSAIIADGAVLQWRLKCSGYLVWPLQLLVFSQ